MRQTKRSPLGQHHNNRCFKQDSSMDANINGQKYDKKQDVCIVSKCLSVGTIEYGGGGVVTRLQRKLADNT